MEIRPFNSGDENAVVQLWQQCDLVRPWNDPHQDILRKLEVKPEWFLVGVIDEEIIASLMVGYDGHRGWLNYLAVTPKFQRRGFARKLVLDAERLLREAGCPKINLQVRTTNSAVIGFYRSLGYAMDEVVSMGKRLVNDDLEK